MIQVPVQANTDKDARAVTALRMLALDMVDAAGSGHPGTPLGAAPLAYVLWCKFLQHNPSNPAWSNRDRFVLSPGHASALLYSLLHLSGYDLPLEELKAFRQWGSKTPGHPEVGHTPGVEVTTGPLGQGFAHGVGMAIAERWLAEHFNRPHHTVVDHTTYAIVSDGDLQEGVTSEAASLAGTLKLGKLVYLYDDNDIQIEGSTDVSFSENVAERFAAYGWQVLGPLDGNDLEAVEAAIREAQEETERPSLIICTTVIGYGSPEQGTAKVHGEPLGLETTRAMKEALDYPAEPFSVPGEVREYLLEAVERGREAERMWQETYDAYADAYPELAAQFEAQLVGDLPEGWDAELNALTFDKPVATRAASGQVLNALAKKVHALMGGSADLSPSTKTTLTGLGDFSSHMPHGHNLHFGVREHAMGSIVNGLALHGGLIPYSATFLTFADYMRPPMRLAALMGLRVVYVFTHDSIGLGEDGPTHQPVEHLMNLRGVPNLTVVRPADATETAEAWRLALTNTEGPTVIVLTRQNLPILNGEDLAATEGLQRGGYTLWESSASPEVILLGTGSETHTALEAGRTLAERGVNVRVVSLPSWERFDAQDAAYCESVLPRKVRVRVAVEAASTLGWEHYVGLDGAVVGMTGFGASAPAEVLYEKFGITAQRVVAEADALLKETTSKGETA